MSEVYRVTLKYVYIFFPFPSLVIPLFLPSQPTISFRIYLELLNYIFKQFSEYYLLSFVFDIVSNIIKQFQVDSINHNKVIGFDLILSRRMQ